MGYIKLDNAPQWVFQYPTCSACTVDLDTDGDGWLCPQCGSVWDMGANDGDKGELYESWSGGTLPGPSLTWDEAMSLAIRRERERHDAYMARLLAGGA